MEGIRRWWHVPRIGSPRQLRRAGFSLALARRRAEARPTCSIHDRHQQNGKSFGVVQVILDSGKNTDGYIAFNILSAQT